MRLCLDLACTGYNARLLDWSFRYCGIDVIAEYVLSGDYMAALNISRFYLRLPADAKLWRAQWFHETHRLTRNHNNQHKAASKLTFRQLLAVAFGLKSAPAWASLVSGELCRIIRSFEIHVAGVYIDDISIRAPDAEACRRHMKLASETAASLGLPFNEKTIGPLQRIPFLGCEIDSMDCTIHVSKEYREYARCRVHEVLHAPWIRSREFSHGFLTSMMLGKHVEG